MKRRTRGDAEQLLAALVRQRDAHRVVELLIV
jgi:hypothetical protein